jgi:signal transduction histidine kinase
MSATPATLLCAAGDCTDLIILRSELEAIAGPTLRVEGHHSGAGLASALEAHVASGTPVPLVIVDARLADGPGINALVDLSNREASGATRKLLTVPEGEAGEVDRAVAAGIIDGVVSRPWSSRAMHAKVAPLVADYLDGAAPEATEREHHPKSAPESASGGPQSTPAEPAQIRSFLTDRKLGDGVVEQAMIDELQHVLDHPPLSCLPAGTLIVTEGDVIDGITVVLDGEVRLFREVEGLEIVFHHLTAGRIIGLMALAQSRPAVFSVEAATDVTVLPVTLEQIDTALRDNPGLTASFVSVLVRSLALRNLRSIEQQLRIREFATTRIRESERLAVVGQLAAGVAHELNNPLQGIVTYSHLLLERTAEDDRRRASIEKIVSQADRCRAIVRALLDFSRPSKPQKQSSEMNSILGDCLDLMEGQALFLNIEIDQSLDPALPLVTADPSQMQQVFVNLIINAVEAMDAAGRLSIITRQSNGYVEIEFSDSGPGIIPEDLERVFDPFFSTKEASHGTGLGLAISYGIVQEHQGSIAVTSDFGAGATFVVRLPIEADRPSINPGG